MYKVQTKKNETSLWATYPPSWRNSISDNGLS